MNKQSETQKAEASFEVFRARTSDVELARQAVGEVHGRTPIDEAALHLFLTDPACYQLLAAADRRVLGSLSGYSLRHPDRSTPQFLLYEVDVRPEFRRRGIGLALVNAFIDEAHAAAVFEIWVLSNESNQAAIELYRKCGFRRRNDDDVMLSVELRGNTQRDAEARVR
jgi:ribosomal protein S18 acetylase RimI-like enzyme